MRPFMSYGEGDYAKHWLDIVGAATDQPIFAHVNWFQKDPEDGHFLAGIPGEPPPAALADAVARR